MKTSSCKAKGRRLAQAVCNKIREKFIRLIPHDVIVQPSGINGEDLRLSPEATRLVPFSIECKNREHINIWQSFEQCKKNTNPHTVRPLLVFSRNKSEIMAVLQFDDLLELLSVLEFRRKGIDSRSLSQDWTALR